jgi:hypothetical protein
VAEVEGGGVEKQQQQQEGEAPTTTPTTPPVPPPATAAPTPATPPLTKAAQKRLRQRERPCPELMKPRSVRCTKGKKCPHTHDPALKRAVRAWIAAAQGGAAGGGLGSVPSSSSSSSSSSALGEKGQDEPGAGVGAGEEEEVVVDPALPALEGLYKGRDPVEGTGCVCVKPFRCLLFFPMA